MCMSLRENGEVTWERLEGGGRGCSFILVKSIHFYPQKTVI